MKLCFPYYFLDLIIVTSFKSIILDLTPRFHFLIMSFKLFPKASYFLKSTDSKLRCAVVPTAVDFYNETLFMRVLTVFFMSQSIYPV